MYLKKEAIKQLENNFGIPREYSFKQEILKKEMVMLKASQKWGRSHDFTFFITNKKDKIAVIRKHQQPLGFYRAPSGGIDPGENILDGINREIFEELGIKATIRTYLVRMNVLFQHQMERVPWVTHVLMAHTHADTLKPIDIEEIKEAKWVDWKDLQGSIQNNLNNSPYGLFHYRVHLTDIIAKIYEGIAM
ncbi:MAG: NUDIX hydrolase [Bacillota bacterium]